jgi:hypothetical protein
MKNKDHYIIILLLLTTVLWLQRGQAQPIWPGDINNNGEVNGVDALYLGLAFGATGPQRTDPSNDWDAQIPPADWVLSFPDGQNYYFADCNGDGVVNEDDLLDGIDDNYLLTHDVFLGDGYANATAGTGPALRLEPSASTVGEFTQVDINLFLGTEAEPVEDFYGIALQLSFGMSQGSNYSDFAFDLLPGSWVAPGNTEAFALFMDEDDIGRADLAVVRNNQQPVALGSGQIGAFSIIMEDIIVGLEADTFLIRVDSVRLISNDLTTTAAVPASTFIVVSRKPNVVGSVELPTASLLLFPNPAGDLVNVYTEGPIHEWTLLTTQGQVVPLGQRRMNDRSYQLSWPVGLPPGIYYLRGRGDGYHWTEKLIIQPR